MCDANNCVFCQPHAQRFRQIVRSEFHGQPCSLGGGAKDGEREGASGTAGPRSLLGSTGANGGVGARSGMPKRKAMSSIWDFDAGASMSSLSSLSSMSSLENRCRDVPVRKDGHVADGGGDDDTDTDTDTREQRSFALLGTFRGQPGPHDHEIVSGLEWEPTHGCLLATAGVSKQVRIYSMATFRGDWEDASTRQDPVRLYRLASKLTSLAWHPVRPGVVAVGDYDGCVTEMDLETGHILHEGDEHAGRRVWGVAYSAQSGCLASASEDGTVALWDANARDVVARISTNANSNTSTSTSTSTNTNTNKKVAVTGVDVSRWNPNLVGLSSADSCAYVYDLRNLSIPVRTLRGHARPVSYIKFYDQNTVVTAGIDSSLISWDVTRGHGGEAEAVRRYAAHSNHKHFTGLSVLPEEGLLACGSETGHVYCYEQRDGAVWCAKNVDHAEREVENDKVFCGAVAWQPAHVSGDGGNGPVIAGALSDASISVCRVSKGDHE